MDWSGYAFDWQHAFLGEAPAIYYLEIFGRTVLLFVFALFLARLLGKRALGQLSPYEFVVLIAMGSALGDPMFYPSVPLLPPMVVMSTIVLMHRAVSWVTERNQRIEDFVEGRSCEVVRDGITNRESLRRERVAFEELAMMLRQKGIQNLADVRLAILETSGKLSVFPYSGGEQRVGLLLECMLRCSGCRRFQAGETVEQDGSFACIGCGQCRDYAASQRFMPCSECAGEQFVEAQRSG